MRQRDQEGRSSGQGTLRVKMRWVEGRTVTLRSKGKEQLTV